MRSLLFLQCAVSYIYPAERLFEEADMAADTSLELRGALIYQILVRDYSQEGTFDSVTADLPRIRSLGSDIVHLLPIHPIGIKNRKGTYGSPYAIRDYRAIDPAYGNEQQLKRLIDKAHALGMKVIMDVVYNHTSPDSDLFQRNPEWFYDKGGRPGNKVGEWWDVIDLDFERGGEGLEAELIANLVFWARFGFDGFRCDVASLVPKGFWLKARKAVFEVKPGAIWLAESVHADFIKQLRRQGFIAHSDSELYDAFDICYEYDVHDRFHDHAYRKGSLKAYKQALGLQEAIYPANYVKLRFIGNHDFERPAALFRERGVLEAWTAFTFFNKGAALVYMGDETLTDHRPSLFEKEPIDWSKTDATHVELIRMLAAMKKMPYFVESSYFEVAEDNDEDSIVAFHELGGKRLYGIFNVGRGRQEAALDVPDGEYAPVIGGKTVVSSGKAKTDSRFSAFEVTV